MSNVASRHFGHRSGITVAMPSASRVAALMAGVAGVALLWVVGFSEIEVLHNVAHDTRHSHVFPCH
ncbi:MAG: CbtB-domain containing protein [Gammaproteobacteria bacterium]|nr:CbtB-domain containing protein [Gammaproteobacteria bacterium]